MADEAEVSAFEETVNARISTAAADLGRWLRPSEAAAHRCVADALADSRLDADAAHEAADKCMEPVSSVRARFSEEMRSMQDKMHACHSDTEDVLKADFKDGKKVDESVLVAKYMKLLRPCVDGHLAGLPAAMERVKTGSGAVKAAKSGWFS